jgi:hypothetical protein
MIATQERPATKSRYEKISARIRELLKGSSDLGLVIRCRTSTMMVVDIGCANPRSRLTAIQINEIARIKEVIKKEFSSRFEICSAPAAGQSGRRIQMQIPLC